MSAIIAIECVLQRETILGRRSDCKPSTPVTLDHLYYGHATRRRLTRTVLHRTALHVFYALYIRILLSRLDRTLFNKIPKIDSLS
ncbi:unnamed protein product, partial [Trichogramma brassicae]